MEEKINDLEIGFLSYNGLNKPVFFAGVPLMMIVFLLGSVFFVCLPLFILFGKIAGTIPAIFLVIIYVFAKISCENDPNALTVITLRVLGFFQYGFKSILGVRG